jgi:nicotinamide mononucleotide transporter
MPDVFQQFTDGLKATTALEFIAVISGIVSVYFSRKESILVYPTGLLNTTLYIYLSIKGHLFGEASVNFYYTIMSLYGWWNWARIDNQHHHVVHITPASKAEWRQQLLFFGVCFLIIYLVLLWVRSAFAPNAIPWADAFASASAFTGMWLMTRKKIESWYWWIATNIVSIPLWFITGYVFTSVQFLVLLGLAIAGLIEWKRRYREQMAEKPLAYQ